MQTLIKNVLAVTGILLWSGGGFAASATGESSGYYKEPKPGSYQLYLQSDQARGAFYGVGPAFDIKRESLKADAHDTTRDYNPGRACEDCHEESTRNIHSIRAEIECTQCHRNEPVAGVYHYYSPLNPIRKHAYVCAKCHEGASAEFGTYLVHEPNPIAEATAEHFPALYYGTWFMVILAGGVFMFFIPYIGLWGIRELIDKIKGGDHDDR